MIAVERDAPLASALQPALVDAAYFWDAYRAPLTTPPASAIDIFFGIFGHHPRWMKIALILRNCVARWCGLSAPTASDILQLERRETYRVGEKIGVWSIFSLNDTELIAGRDNGHLDFRLSILRELNRPSPAVVVSTVCVVHNRFGKVYLFFVAPFHKWGVRHIIENAIRAGRL